MGGGGGSVFLPLLPLHTAHHHSPQNLQYRKQNTEYKRQNTETHLHKISNIPDFYMALGLNDFDAGKGVGPENRDFFGS